MSGSTNPAHPHTRSGAPLGMVFILGAPRSGTSWVQRLAAERPGVATVPELHLFARYLRPITKAWQNEKARLAPVTAAIAAGETPPHRAIGLPTALSDDDFRGVARGFLDAVAREVLDARPDVELLIEKTPSNSLVVPLLLGLYPEAGYLHVVRDPRAVVRSLRSAGMSWAGSWAPRSALVGALAWRAHVVGARRAEAPAGDNYLEVRYEDLRAGSPVTQQRLREWLAARTSSPGDTPGGEVQLVVSPELRALLDGRPLPEPDEFGDGTQVRPPLTRLQTLVVEAVCGDLMDSLDYPRSRVSAPVGRAALGALHRLERRLSPERVEGMTFLLQHRRTRLWPRGRR